MPGYDRRNNFRPQRRNMGGGGGGGGSHHGGGGMINPWETGVAPGMQPQSLLGNFQPNFQSQLLLNNVFNRAQMGGGNQYGGPNKIRRVDGMGSFNDHRSRDHHLPSLMGDYSHNFARSNVQQRLGSSDRRSGSGYYPSESRDKRRFNRARPSTKRTRSRSRDRRSRDDRHRRSKDSRKKSPSKDESDTIKKEKNEDEKPEDSEEKAEKAEEPKEKSDEKDGAESKDKDSKKEDRRKEEPPFPVECLYCHICDVEPFQTKKGFIRHLEAVTHSKMAEAFHKKNATLLDFLVVSAKYAEMRRKDKLIRTANKKGLPLGRIPEKKILQNYLNVDDCCGKRFESPYDLHEHKLSIYHLKKKFEKGEKEVKNENENSVTEVSEMEVDKQITEAKDEIEKNPFSSENIPPYDPTMPFGLHLIEKKVLYRCSLCNTNSITSLDEHCQSYDHYENAVAAINKEEERKQIEKIKAEEEKKKAEEEKRAKEREERRKKEEKEEEGKSGLMKDQMIILDEEKEDDDMMTDEHEPKSIMDTMIHSEGEQEEEDEPMGEGEEHPEDCNEDGENEEADEAHEKSAELDENEEHVEIKQEEPQENEEEELHLEEEEEVHLKEEEEVHLKEEEEEEVENIKQEEPEIKEEEEEKVSNFPRARRSRRRM